MSSSQPFAFLSSFTEEFGGWLPDGTLDTTSLRYRASKLGETEGKTVWVAERVRMDLHPFHTQPLHIVDALWEQIRKCNVFICVLGGNRRGQHEHGTRIPINEKVAPVSYFEAELVLAALLGKRIELFIVKGFDPGPRLSSLLEMLRFALPAESWRVPLSEEEILREIETVVKKGLTRPLIPAWVPRLWPGVAGWLLSRMYDTRALRCGLPAGQRPVFFLDGAVEDHPGSPDKDLVNTMLADSGTTGSMEGKLARLWIAVRELMAEPIGPDCREDVLILWNNVLKKWASDAAWYGLHGPTFLSQLAALHSVAEARKWLRSKGARLRPEEVEHPVSLASALYSTAKLMPTRDEQRIVFEDGLAHLNNSIRERGGLTANLAQMSGSFYLRLGQTNRAVEAYEDALRRRHYEKACESQVGESMSELGFAYLRQMRLFKGCEVMKEGVTLLEKDKDKSPGFYARGLRKLAVGYAVTGRPGKALEALKESRRVAREKHLFDQVR